LSIDGTTIFTLVGGTGSTGANKPNGSDGSESTNSDYLTSPVMIYASSLLNNETPDIKIKY